VRLSVFTRVFVLLFVTATLCLIQWEATPLGVAIWVASFVLALCIAYAAELIAQVRRDHYRLRILREIQARNQREREGAR
jgi:type IV secretory pathway TrbD component